MSLFYSTTIGCVQPCRADDPEMQQGMAQYRKHEYVDALTHLGSALSTEFNNANLHYHMANCLVHMRQKESAIREYRIAYALDPYGKIGNYSKMCLHLFGIDAAGALPLPEAPPKIEKKSKDEVDSIALKKPKDTKNDADQKDNKDSKEAKDLKDSSLNRVAKYVSEEEKVKQNLQDLLQQKVRPGNARLQEIGTNVFVRNYKEPQRLADADKNLKRKN